MGSREISRAATFRAAKAALASSRGRSPQSPIHLHREFQPRERRQSLCRLSRGEEVLNARLLVPAARSLSERDKSQNAWVAGSEGFAQGPERAIFDESQSAPQTGPSTMPPDPATPPLDDACPKTHSRQPASHLPTESHPDMLGGGPVLLGEAEHRGDS